MIHRQIQRRKKVDGKPTREELELDVWNEELYGVSPRMQR